VLSTFQERESMKEIEMLIAIAIEMLIAIA
jgi:hypothetical protein